MKKNVLTKLPAGEIIEIKKLADGTFEVLQEVTEEVVSETKVVSDILIDAENLSPNDTFMKHKPCTKEEGKGAGKESHSISKIVIHDTTFVLIEAESLSLDDKFMKYEPPTKSGESIKEFITEAINSRVKNFYRPIMDPSFTDDGIGYVAGKMPAVGKSYNWWIDTAKKYDPSRNSRLGTRLEYGGFLGVLIKKLVEEGKPVEWAWNAVCNDSKELGHYWNSEDAKHDFEPTGSRLVCGFYDLANTRKILSEDVEVGGYCLACGAYNCSSDFYPTAQVFSRANHDCNLANSVGWIVLS